MTINLQKPDITELKPRITVFGVGGGGGNAVNNMINAGLEGVDFVVANTDAQALTMSKSERIIQLGVAVTEGLGAGSQPEIGAAAAEECFDEINDHLNGTHMCFVTAGMGGGTGTGAAPVVAKAARQKGILTVGVVTKPFHFEGQRRMHLADQGIEELQKNVDTLIVIPNQNLFRIANENTTFADAFSMADQVLFSGVACITDLMTKEGLINLDFADVRSVMREMGKAMMGTGEASGDGRAMTAAEAAIANPLLDETSMSGAQGLLISITGGRDMTLFEVDEAATRIREEVDPEANIILGATFDESLEGIIRVSVVATGIDYTVAQSISHSHPDMRASMASIQNQMNPDQSMKTASAALEGETLVSVEEEISVKMETSTPENRLFVHDTETEKPAVLPTPESKPVKDISGANAIKKDGIVSSGLSAEQIRMPQIEDFPATVKAEIDQVRSNAQNDSGNEKGAKSLFKRISSSLGIGEEDVSVTARKAIEQQVPQPRSMSGHNKAHSPAVSGNLDNQGRVVHNSPALSEDEQLEIPAFLRRQIR